jgi:hypothetical protein
MPRVVVKRSRAELIRKVETGKAELARPSPFPSGSSSRGTQKKNRKTGQRSGGLSGYTYRDVTDKIEHPFILIGRS